MLIVPPKKHVLRSHISFYSVFYTDLNCHGAHLIRFHEYKMCPSCIYNEVRWLEFVVEGIVKSDDGVIYILIICRTYRIASSIPDNPALYNPVKWTKGNLC